ncbi:PREDICTED: uncharacterized protein LOC105617679 [Atta cephalotes]|uniref:Secreted protein n=1 Tax=Atta cephalotes TaxID=12957 RepID=A0A158NAR7_ATTCE|nr:PREDICTED: uncharacterized protein LOC105617679 [Atta cephalotes]
MKLLLLLSFIILVSESLVAEKTTDGNDVSSQVTTVFQAQPSAQEFIGEKKLLRKRSYDLLSLPYTRTYAPVLPWYRGGLSSYGLYGNGWYPSGWPLSYGGWHSDWYKGCSGPQFSSPVPSTCDLVEIRDQTLKKSNDENGSRFH